MSTSMVGVGIDARKSRKGADEFDKATDDVRRSARRMDRGLRSSQKEFQQFERRASLATSALKGFLGGLAAYVSVAGFTRLLGRSLELFREQEKVVAQLNAGLRATGGVVGFTSKELQQMASDLQSVTTFGDEAIIKTQQLLLTFPKIRGDVFKEAIVASMNLSEVLGTNLKDSALQVAKALQDPVLGLTALSRSGTTFTEQQKVMVKQLVESGDMLGAQRLILDELSAQYSGRATAAAQTFDGKLKQLSNTVGDTLERLGEALFKNDLFIAGLDKLKRVAEGMTFENLRGALNAIPKLFKVAQMVFGQFVDIGKSGLAELETAFRTDFSDNISRSINGVTEFLGKAMKQWLQVMLIFPESVASLVAIAVGEFQVFVARGTSEFEIFKKNVSLVFDALKIQVQKIFGSIVAGIIKTLNKGIDAISNFYQKAASFFGEDTFLGNFYKGLAEGAGELRLSLEGVDDVLADATEQQERLRRESVQFAAEQRRNARDQVAAIREVIASSIDYEDSIAREKLARLDALLATIEWSDTTDEALDGAIEKQKELNKETGEGSQAAITQQTDAVENDLRPVWEEALKRIDGAFVELWKSGLDGFKEFKDAVIGTFKQLIAEMIQAALRNRILFSFGFTGASGTAGAAGSAASGALGSASGGFLGLGNIGAAIQAGGGLGALGSAALGPGALILAGNALGENSSSVGAILGGAGGYAFASSAAGAGFLGATGVASGLSSATGLALGTVVPIIGLVMGAVLGSIGRIMNNNTNPSSQISFGQSRGDQDIQVSDAFGGVFLGSGRDGFLSDYQAQVGEVYTAFFDGLNQVVTDSQREAITNLLQSGGDIQVTREMLASGDLLGGIFDQIMGVIEPEVREFVMGFENIEEQLTALQVANVFGTDNPVLGLISGLEEIMGFVTEVGDIGQAVGLWERYFTQFYDATEQQGQAIEQAQQAVQSIVNELGRPDLTFDNFRQEFEAALPTLSDAEIVQWLEAGNALALLNEILASVGETAATLATDTLLSAVTQYVGIANDFERAGMSLDERLSSNRDALRALTDSFDESQESVDELARLTEERYTLELQWLERTRDIAASIAELLGGSAGSIEADLERIRLENLPSDQARYEDLRAQAEALAATLPSITDPQVLDATVREIDRLVNQAYSLLDDNQRLIAGPDIAQFLRDVNTMAQNQLETLTDRFLQESAIMADRVELTAGTVIITSDDMTATDPSAANDFRKSRNEVPAAVLEFVAESNANMLEQLEAMVTQLLTQGLDQMQINQALMEVIGNMATRGAVATVRHQKVNHAR